MTAIDLNLAQHLRITEGHVDDDGDELFDIADEIEHDIMTAQEHLEKIYEVLSSITDCWPE